MSHCIPFWKKFLKEGDFCGLDPAEISRIKAYLEFVEKIEKTGVEQDFIFKNFTAGAARPLLSLDDETRTKGLNYVVSCLKRQEKVTAKDLQTTINGWLKPDSCSVGHPEQVDKKLTNVKSSGVKPDLDRQTISSTPPTAPLHPTLGHQIRKQEMAEAEKNQPQEPEACTSPPAPVDQEPPPPRPPTPAPCLSLKGCPDFQNHVDTSNKMLGRVCNVIRIPCNQLPGPDKECPLERKERLKNTAPAGFIRAGELVEEIAGAKVIKPAPYKIAKSRLPDSERDVLVNTLIEHTSFTAKDIEQIDELVKVNREGWACRFDLVEAAVMMLLAKAEGS